jgi:hypothetical protein
VLNYRMLIVGIAFVTLVGGCAGGASRSENSVPDWILNPQSSDGTLVASGCADRSDSLGLDRKIALAKARSNLAQQIKIKIQGVDKVYAKKVNDGAAQNVFESVSEQITDNTLQNVKIDKIKTLTIDGKKQLCTLISMSKEQSKTMFRSIVKATSLAINAEEEEKLYNQFTEF